MAGKGMALGGCLSCIKYLVFVFNFLFWLVGCVILALGIWILVDPGSIDLGDVDKQFKIAAIVLVVLGSIIMIVGFLGCCGAIRESQCMLATFFVFLFIIFAVLLTIGIYVIIKKDKPEELKAKLKEAIKADLKIAVEHQSDQAFKEKMEKMEKEYSCCGYDKGLSDYGSGSVQRLSCGQHFTTSCTDALTNKSFDTIQKHSVIIAGVAIGIGIVMSSATKVSSAKLLLTDVDQEMKGFHWMRKLFLCERALIMRTSAHSASLDYSAVCSSTSLDYSAVCSSTV